MKTKLLFLLFNFFLLAISQDAKTYIKQYSSLAVSEMHHLKPIVENITPIVAII